MAEPLIPSYGLSPEELRILPNRLAWPDVDPARHPFDAAEARAVVHSVAPPVPPAPSTFDRDARAVAERWRDEMCHALVDRYGRWAAGWRWSVGEGDFDGGPVGGWCCVRDSITTPDETLDLVAECLIEWRGWLENLAERFERVLPLLDPLQPADDLALSWEMAVAQVVTATVDRTRHESGWHRHCEQVLEWLLTAAGVAEENRAGLIRSAVGLRFESWIEPARTVVDEVAERVAKSVLAEVRDDDLAAWCAVRREVDWRAVTGPVEGPIRGDRDAVADHAARHPSGRMPAALGEARAAARAGAPLTFALLARWQRTVLGVDDAAFRTRPARAKGGRERYGWWPGLPELFERCLAEADDPAVPLPSRAARVYLDVAFFHPFDDGNARAATLALSFVLAREGVVLGYAEPLLTVSRVARDAAGAVEFARLVQKLIRRSVVPVGHHAVRGGSHRRSEQAP